MSRSRRVAVCCLLLCLGLLLWSRGRVLALGMAGQPRTYRIQYAQAVEIPRQNQDLLEEQAGNFVFARQTRDASISSQQFKREARVTWLETLGDGALLLTDQPMLSGQTPQPYSNQCAVDADTAVALWGTADVAGKTLSLDQEEYLVTGVFSSKRPLLLTSWRGQGSFWAAYGVYAPPGDSAFPKQEQEQFLSRCGLPAAEFVTSPLDRALVLLQLSQLPLWILGIVLAHRWIKGLLPGVSSGLCWLRRLLLLLAMVLLGLALDFSLPLLPEYLPTRWSDFSFWSGQIKDLANRAAAGWVLPGLLPAYLTIYSGALPALLFTASSGLCVVLLLALTRPDWERRRTALWYE